MSNYEQRDNSGSLFKNDRKKKPNHPDYKGSAMVDGVEYWLSAWTKKTQKGTSFMSLALTPKDDGYGKAARPSRRPADSRTDIDLDDEIPF